MTEDYFAWIKMELEHLGHPILKDTLEKCLDGMHNRDLCEYLGVNYSRMNFDDRRKIYFHIAKGDGEYRS